MTESIIDIENIESIELSSKDIETNKETRKLSFLGELESHNVIIRLKEEETLIGLYGIRKKFKILALHVDNKIEFQDRINNAL
jgi:small nuclear ribonucleoprotein (snRNP)-like protein